MVNITNNDDSDSNMQVDSDLDADGEYLVQSERAPSEPEPQPSNFPSANTSLHNGSKDPRPDYSADPELYGLRRSVSPVLAPNVWSHFCPSSYSHFFHCRKGIETEGAVRLRYAELYLHSSLAHTIGQGYEDQSSNAASEADNDDAYGEKRIKKKKLSKPKSEHSS
jgi:hypothetical protein